MTFVNTEEETRFRNLFEKNGCLMNFRNDDSQNVIEALVLMDSDGVLSFVCDFELGGQDLRIVMRKPLSLKSVEMSRVDETDLKLEYDDFDYDEVIRSQLTFVFETTRMRNYIHNMFVQIAGK